MRVRKYVGVILALVFPFFTFFPDSAQALVEFRAHYGLYGSQEPLQRKTLRLPLLNSWGLDAMIFPTLVPVSFGLRYENFIQNQTLSQESLKVDLKRVSVLLSYNIIKTLFFLRATGTLGLHHEGRTHIQLNKISSESFNTVINGSYSLGVEGGFRLSTYIMGVELGYLTMTDRGVEPLQKYDGFYGKIYLGLGF